MLKLYVNNKEVEVNVVRFPAGESLISLKDDKRLGIGVIATIILKFKNNSDIINLILLTDAVRRHYGKATTIDLEIPYFPYARQDRVCNRGESLSVKVIADLINSQNYNEVKISDPHSDVTPALINNVTIRSLSKCAFRLSEILTKDNTILISPDAGANKKVYDVAKDWGFDEVVRADKTRNVTTGKITGSKIFIDAEKYKFNVETARFTNKDCLILDDICDGGYTFIQLAKELEGFTTGRIFLYVTHGIFSKGILPLLDAGIHAVYVSNNMSEWNNLNLLNKDNETFLRVLS